MYGGHGRVCLCVCHYHTPIDWWQIRWRRVKFGLPFSGSKFFTQFISRTLFVGARRKLTVLWVSPYLTNFGLHFRPQNFWQRLSGTFCQSSTKFGRAGQSNLFPEFRGPGGPVIPCGNMHRPFTDTAVKLFLTTSLRLPIVLLWPPYVIGGGGIIFLPCSFYLSIFFLIFLA